MSLLWLFGSINFLQEFSWFGCRLECWIQWSSFRFCHWYCWRCWCQRNSSAASFICWHDSYFDFCRSSGIVWPDCRLNSSHKKFWKVIYSLITLQFNVLLVWNWLCLIGLLAWLIFILKSVQVINLKQQLGLRLIIIFCYKMSVKYHDQYYLRLPAWDVSVFLNLQLCSLYFFKICFYEWHKNKGLFIECCWILKVAALTYFSISYW